MPTQTASPIATRCSKNYINCRKHPSRTGTAEMRFSSALKYARNAAKGAVTEARNALLKKTAEYEEQNADLKVAEQRYLARLQKDLDDAENKHAALQPEASFNRWMEAHRGDKPVHRHPAWEHRLAAFDTIKKNIDKELALENVQPLDNFKAAVASLLVDEAEFINPEHHVWGDNRGGHYYSAQSHLKQNCHVALLENYDEHASWMTYDTFSEDHSIGISADVSCACGEVYKAKAYLGGNNMGSLISRLLNR